MTLGTIIVMALVGLAGLLGLFEASRAIDTGFYTFGLVVFGFAVLLDFWLIKRYFDQQESD